MERKGPGGWEGVHLHQGWLRYMLCAVRIAVGGGVESFSQRAYCRLVLREANNSLTHFESQEKNR